MTKPLMLTCLLLVSGIVATGGSAAPTLPARAAATYSLNGKILAVKHGATTALRVRLDSATLGIGAGAQPASSLAGVRRVRVLVTSSTQIVRPGRGTLTPRALRRGQFVAVQATASARATAKSVFRARLLTITSR
jgi:hypothetical protein